MTGGGSVDEVAGSPNQMASALSAGVNVVDLDQTVTFVEYRRLVLPLDGFVFWCRADTLSPSALANTSPVNNFALNQAPQVTVPARTIVAQGSLHHTTVNRQNLDESSSTNRMVFTSKDEVVDLNDIAPDSLYLATVAGNRYTFSSRNMFYKQAALYHYTGDAVYPALATQIIDNPAQLNATEAVVSNSLPIWLTLNQFFPVYPSLLIPDNIRPPYAAVHIGEDDTSPLQSAPIFDRHLTRWQLTKDVVHVTTYGVRNNTIMDWLDSVQDYALAHPGVMGIMNSPIPRDAKRGQTEISTIAQKKLITFDVDYYQVRMRNLARQLILSAFVEEFIVEADIDILV